MISHGHHQQTTHLLSQLAQLCATDLNQVIITDNLADHAAQDYVGHAGRFPFEVTYVSNPHPLGFGANHNRAFALCKSDYFCVMNPDIELIESPFGSLALAIERQGVAVSYPVQMDCDKLLLDFERRLVTPCALFVRHALRNLFAPEDTKNSHWASGAFLVFKNEVFRALDGFDEGYFMYCEDVDICLRAQLAGYRLARADATVVHHTQRRTLKNVQHLAWHVRSLWRLWHSQAYLQYKKQFIDRNN